ncbi:MAG TPA: polyprenyl synthetase family protein [Polyangiales bacterium]|nr:polyprenyl synthetase family protein [Polyangiales bacterium]
MSQSWTGQIVASVNEHLRTLFETKRAQVTEMSPYAAELLDAAAELTMRGGKRLRCLILYAGYRASGGPADTARILELSAAIELLQTYLLIQDDWMDDDAERRGGPSVHAALAQKRNDAKLGASLAILASDLAAGFAHEALQRGAVASKRTSEILARFSQMHTEVVCGQQMDLLEHTDVERMHDLKTGSYTVRGPLQIGALLADATPEQLAALDRFGRPLGIAFQLRDDLLGTYGDPAVTGKPAGHDLREGKNTSLIREARALLDGQAWSQLASVLGNANATAPQLSEAARVLETSGARARVEAHLATLANEAESALVAAPLGAEGVAMLRELLNKLVLRDR